MLVCSRLWRVSLSDSVPASRPPAVRPLTDNPSDLDIANSVAIRLFFPWNHENSSGRNHLLCKPGLRVLLKDDVICRQVSRVFQQIWQLTGYVVTCIRFSLFVNKVKLALSARDGAISELFIRLSSNSCNLYITLNAVAKLAVGIHGRNLLL